MMGFLIRLINFSDSLLSFSETLRTLNQTTQLLTMNPLSATLQDMFKCSFCQLSFVDVVKVVPDCDVLICGACHHDLNSTSDSNRQFRCKSCQKDHKMSPEELADVMALMQMLKFKPEKLVSGDGAAEVFKNQIEDSSQRCSGEFHQEF